ncbi:MAG: Inosine-5-monophosphate dehydrogenase [Mycobacterium sp.]|nr:Inosine-5-monophosphate dehydrogenase [Mycobacterium sp.]
MAEVEIGIGKGGRRAYALEDVVIVPSRRARDPQDVSTSWEIDAYRFELPIMAAAMDSVSSPAFVIAMGRLGGLGVLNLEGLWCRYDDPEPLLAELADTPAAQATAKLQQVYAAAPVREDLIRARIAEVKAAGVTVAAALTPQRTVEFHKAVLDAGVDLFVIQGTVVSAEYKSSRVEPLNLKQFIADLDAPVIVGGVASFSTALHCMRTGAAGVLVGVGPGSSDTTRSVLGVGVPMATALADAAGARMRYLDESGGRYVHVIADGGMRTGGDMAKAIACGADAVMLGMPLAHAAEAPGAGWHWGNEVFHAELPRGARVATPAVGTLEQVLLGPSARSDGAGNLVGALRRAMAVTGYESVKHFQKAELMVAPAR